jgi:hypothetical protein
VQQVDAESDMRTVSVRIGYSGRPDFMIGVDLYGTRVRDLNITDPVKSIGAILTTRYYF